MKKAERFVVKTDKFSARPMKGLPFEKGYFLERVEGVYISKLVALRRLKIASQPEQV